MHLTGIQTRKNNTANSVPTPPHYSLKKISICSYCIVLSLCKQKTLNKLVLSKNVRVSDRNEIFLARAFTTMRILFCFGSDFVAQLEQG